MSQVPGFRSNPNKDYLRSTIDKALVLRWFTAVGRPLQYLGLPGPEMLDIIEWQEYLDQFTTIERLDSQQHLLFLRANVRDVEHRLYALHGEFDEILRTGRDLYGHAPHWPYDVVNLDFFGGLLYSDLSRPRAIRKLIENQAAHKRSFMLIMTHDLRDADKGGEKKSFIIDLKKRLDRDLPGHQSDTALDWYALPETPDSARQALFTNLFLRDAAEDSQFTVVCRPATIYSGTGGTKMVHYLTDFLFTGGIHHAVSEQSLVAILNLGVTEVVEASHLVPAYVVPQFSAP